MHDFKLYHYNSDKYQESHAKSPWWQELENLSRIYRSTDTDGAVFKNCGDEKSSHTGNMNDGNLNEHTTLINKTQI
jgi:hypothetical protein